MLASILDFRRKQHAAWVAFRSGLRDAPFPAGKWFAWRYYGARREQGEAAPLAAPS